MIPEVRVLRHSFYPMRHSGQLRWTESAPPSAHPHPTWGNCTIPVETQPAGVPVTVHQELTVAWPDCLVILDKESSAPWVKFRRAGDIDAWVARGWSGTRDPGDEDHAYFQFHQEENSLQIEIGSPGFGLTGVLLTPLFLGNHVDVRRLYNGYLPSEIVDLSKIAPDQVWIHACSWGKEAMRTLGKEAEIDVFHEAFHLARTARELVTPLLDAFAVPVDQLRDQATARCLPEIAGALRSLLEPVAYHVEETELFRLVGEMEAEISASGEQP